jgi:hypothetical protein
LAKKEYTGGTESGLGTLWQLILSGLNENQNSDFVTVIKLDELDTMTKSEF